MFGDGELDEMLDLVGDSDCDEDVFWSGSRPGRAVNVDCDLKVGAVILHNDYTCRGQPI